MFSVPFLGQISSLFDTTPIDDSIDRLSCLITSFFFFFAAILISAKTYVGSPITCWMPQTYTSKWDQYAEDYCFLKDTYWYPTFEVVADIPEEHKEKYRLSYYQWSSMYLTISAVVFMMPKFLWKMSQTVTDIPLIYFCETTKAISTLNASQRAERVSEMAMFFRNKITTINSPNSIARVSMYFVYQVTKIFYVIIAVLQFITLSVFIGQKHDLLWGWHLYQNLMDGDDWETTGMFPRLTFCDIHVRQMAGHNNQDTIQCLLGINEFNETIFLFLWFWLVILIFFTTIGAVYTFNRNKYVDFVCNLLQKVHDSNNQLERTTIKLFADTYLTLDGKLILSFIKSQSYIVAQELAVYMYYDFNEQMGAQLHSETMANDTELGLVETFEDETEPRMSNKVGEEIELEEMNKVGSDTELVAIEKMKDDMELEVVEKVGNDIQLAVFDKSVNKKNI